MALVAFYIKLKNTFLSSRENTKAQLMTAETVQPYRYWKIQFCLIYFVQHLHSESWLGEVDALFMHMQSTGCEKDVDYKDVIWISFYLPWGLPWSARLSVLLSTVCIAPLNSMNLCIVLQRETNYHNRLKTFHLCSSAHTRNVHLNVSWYLLKNPQRRWKWQEFL